VKTHVAIIVTHIRRFTYIMMCAKFILHARMTRVEEEFYFFAFIEHVMTFYTLLTASYNLHVIRFCLCMLLTDILV